MKTSLLKTLKTEEDKQEIKGLFIQSLRLRRVYIETLETKMRVNAEQRISNDYSSPSWGYAQADKNGYERACRELISMLEEEK